MVLRRLRCSGDSSRGIVVLEKTHRIFELLRMAGRTCEASLVVWYEKLLLGFETVLLLLSLRGQR